MREKVFRKIVLENFLAIVNLNNKDFWDSAVHFAQK